VIAADIPSGIALVPGERERGREGERERGREGERSS